MVFAYMNGFFVNSHSRIFSLMALSNQLPHPLILLYCLRSKLRGMPSLDYNRENVVLMDKISCRAVFQYYGEYANSVKHMKKHFIHIPLDKLLEKDEASQVS